MDLEALQFEVTVFLGRTELPAHARLLVGDILVLDQPIEAGLEVWAGEKKCFTATPGLEATHKAMRIDERI